MWEKGLKESSNTNLYAVALLQILGHGFDHGLKKEPGILWEGNPRLAGIRLTIAQWSKSLGKSSYLQWFGVGGWGGDLKCQSNKTEDVENKQWHAQVNRKLSNETVLIVRIYSLQVHPLLANTDTTAENILFSTDRSKLENPPWAAYCWYCSPQFAWGWRSWPRPAPREWWLGSLSLGSWLQTHTTKEKKVRVVVEK